MVQYNLLSHFIELRLAKVGVLVKLYESAAQAAETPGRALKLSTHPNAGTALQELGFEPVLSRDLEAKLIQFLLEGKQDEARKMVLEV